MSILNYQKDGGIVTLTMDHPESRNALTGNTMVDEFVDACARITADTSVKVVVVTGAGSVFSSGGNVKDLKRFADHEVAPVAIRDWYQTGIQRLPLALYNLDVPTIAAVNGGAIGAGCDLACMCDIRIAAQSAKFAESFIQVGLVPGDGGAWFLQRIVGSSKAAEMTFTGDQIDAKDALKCGLVSQVVPLELLMDAAYSLAKRIARNPGATLRLSKKLMRESGHMRLESLLEISASYQALAQMTPEHREAVYAFIEKRPPKFD
jgi:enoyl-CoA hydratase/carnithine racemase